MLLVKRGLRPAACGAIFMLALVIARGQEVNLDATSTSRQLLQGGFGDVFGGGFPNFPTAPNPLFGQGGSSPPSGGFSPSNPFAPGGGSGATTSATKPTTSDGSNWDLVVRGKVKGSPANVWKAMNSPDSALGIAFRTFAYKVNRIGSVTKIDLNSAQNMNFQQDATSNVGKFHKYTINAHTLQIFNIQPSFVDIRGSEMYIQVLGNQPATISMGLKLKVKPASTRNSILFFMEGFLESLITHYKMKFGPGDCSDSPTNREATGICNNPDPLKGSSNTALSRRGGSDPSYGNGRNTPGGSVVSARLISNIVGAQGTTGDNASNKLKLADIFVFFGQFVDHDVGISPVGAFAEGKQPLFTTSHELFAEPFPIPVPQNDPVFTGANRKSFIPLERTVYMRENNVEVVPRELINAITSFLDLGQVYGSDEIRRKALRSFRGGKMKTSSGNFLPYNGNRAGGVGISIENAPNAGSDNYVAGDVRVTENVNLASLHTIWMREHNLVASELANSIRGLDDETLFRYARDICIAEYQSIIYSEWLPLLLGGNVLRPTAYRYNSGIDPGMDAFFTTAAYRFGHSMVNNILWKVAKGQKRPFATFSLREVFFEPSKITPSSIDDWTRGMVWHMAREMDEKVVDDLRSFLFTEGGRPNLDLYALNIQRGREMGLPSYNDARAMFGLSRARSFADISNDPAVRDKLSRAYGGDVNDVDAFVGGLAEKKPAERLFGDLFQASISDQFRRLRDGDRFFYKGFQFPAAVRQNYGRLNTILNDGVKMADIIARNTGASKSDLLGSSRQTVFQL